MTEKEFTDRSLGNRGATYEAGTTPKRGNWCALQALEDTVVATIEANDWEGDTLTAIPIPAGVIVCGQINAFTLASGKVLAYKR